MQLSTTDYLEEINKQSQSKFYDWSYHKLLQAGFNSEWAHTINSIVLLFLVILILLIIDFLARKVILSVVTRFIIKSKNSIDDYLIKNKTLKYISHFIPLFIAQQISPIIFLGFPNWLEAINKGIEILLVLNIMLIVHSALKTLRDILKTRKSFADKPLESYLQVSQIVLICIGGTITFSILTGISPLSFLVSLGAASAILMLVFKDTILGFVASISVSANDSIRVGDWIEMPKHNADGTVIEINLNNVKVQNFDKTITTIPTHTLLIDSFKNYRGMQTSGGRRIKRAINIKISTIRFMTEEEIKDLERIQILKPFIEQRRLEISEYNNRSQADQSMPVNGRKMTNIGLFRAYATAYIRQNPNINKDMISMVRQMDPTEHGVPLEIYVFSNDTRFEIYEGIRSDLFDHLFAVITYFKLEVFESPASDDLRNLSIKIDHTHLQ
ncbi:mechanosensitive ion channel family protein [Sphingobacterium sp. UDSM-2020]|uniref:mechanosensitive ion channel family protein n=1 Tax=Sphingobacterium sp. UDSM-2020 TaxID=2795738 RepID=UPI0019381BBC|nr:mechanosensitive ion channel domain-containing protein [Sphingobacterium sp. UDSM-2020]QQD11798.1 mechanosensitive ion channel [Sphingobacterium sp. UDSM-2020]